MTRAFIAEQHPSARAIAGAPAARTDGQRQDATDDVMAGFAALIKGLLPDVPNADAVAASLAKDSKFLKMIVTGLLQREGAGVISLAVASYLRDNEVAVVNRYVIQRTRHPFAWLGALLGGLAGAALSLIIMANTEIGRFQDAVEGKLIILDSLSAYGPWQWTLVALVTMAFGAVGGIIGALVHSEHYFVPVRHDDLPTILNVAKETNA
ncbi:MAG TPA: hypothetical protein VLA88_00320 [Candidatus Saccharimonadales bacterium]|nr:hypothetical protein [Candidatus Saccharimonadales bacterium]